MSIIPKQFASALFEILDLVPQILLRDPEFLRQALQAKEFFRIQPVELPVQRDLVPAHAIAADIAIYDF